MDFSREIRRLLLITLLIYVAIALVAAYWAVMGYEGLLQREDNPRLVEAEAAIRRGAIYDRDDVLLAESTVVDEGVERHYYDDTMASAVGYFSFRYGVGGAEAAYDEILSGDNRRDEFAAMFEQDILHRPQEGADIRLAFDSEVQQRITRALGDRRGAVVVLSVPDGAVLALVSQPTFDPNTLDEHWEELVEADGNPFFNRVLQGQYQPGGILQTPLMSAGILTRQPFDTITANATTPVRLSDVSIGCATNPPMDDLTYAQAYAYGCPRPFALLVQQVDEAVLTDIIEAFRLDNPPTLDGFIADIDDLANGSDEPNGDHTLIAELLGQGDLTINPLGSASIAAAVMNEGNAPQPYTLAATRAPNDEWVAMSQNSNSIPMMTANTARRLRELMIGNTSVGAATSAYRDGLTIGSHAALAYAGDTTHAWYIGFVVTEGNRGAAIAVLLEDTDDPLMAAHIGGAGLASAYVTLTATGEE